jgi:hypothetical protein
LVEFAGSHGGSLDPAPAGGVRQFFTRANARVLGRQP